ncbi:DUF6110 family protein [Halodesulfovibrio marinisediminis]|uniref:Uncharacterized protein n=1 Tax=Halodesulfovibrio marinisediminis DSM 17456 TaxID=1121457 RepID=A0A1N6FUQ8_9BACT|nr:DUF6110 family protein [Halodesulfovibrio marinisediminis]SIN98983.1 hypothetical protein SAMN02745161_1523 [Halodesulfovibrio marinisediminis DSM 17456]
MAVNRLAYFLAGAVLGAAGLAMVKSGKGKQLVSGVIHGGCGLAESVLARVETVKEDIEDYVAEMKYKAEQAKEAAAEAEDTSVEPEVEPAPEAKEESTVDSSESKGE